MNQATRAPGWWYPWIFVGCMGVVIVVNAILVYFALGSWTGLETDNHYRKGLAYNQDLEAQRAQAERGWTASLDVASQPSGDRSFPITVTLRDKDGAPLTGLSVNARAERPTHEGFDAEVGLGEQGGGVYGGQLPLRLAGQWKVRIVAAQGTDQFQMVQRITVP